MRRWLAVILSLSIALALAGLWWQAQGPLPPDEAGLRLQGVMGEASVEESGDGGFARAIPGYRLHFPRDHHQHPAFRNEWWYLTGQLQDVEDPALAFGFQLTLFRFALAPPDRVAADNPWIDAQFYMGHFAVTDIDGGRHLSAERFSRRGPGLAGAGGTPLRVWLGDWSLQSESAASLFPLTLEARDGERALALRLDAAKPMLLQGEEGFSLKNDAGGASYYYSYPRLAGEGRLMLDGRSHRVSAQAWYDHEWSSNSLAPEQAGWDWFSLQLEDGRDLMFYRFRNRDGSEGLRQLALVDAAGKRVEVAAEALVLRELDHWTSPAGRRYPAAWRLQLPSQGLDLKIRPRVRDQEMRLSVTYWEGAVAVEGSHRGRGYVELAGY